LFNGTSDFLASAATLDLTPYSRIAIGFWINTTFAADDDIILEFSPNSNTNDGAFKIIGAESSSGNFWVDVNGSGGKQNGNVAPPSDNTWHQITINLLTTSPSTVVESIYFDGVSQTLTRSGGTPGGTFGNYTLYVMSRAGTALFEDGKLADLAIWAPATALSSSDAAALTAGTRAGSVRTSEIVYYWELLGVTSPEPADIGSTALTVTGATGSTGPPALDPTNPSAELDVTATITAVGATNGTSTLTGTATITAAGTATGIAALTATAAITPTATSNGTAAVTATANITETDTAIGAATLTGTATITAAGTVTVLSGPTSPIVVTAARDAAIYYRTLGRGTPNPAFIDRASAADASLTGSATLTATGAVTATGSTGIDTTATLTGIATITAAGTVTTGNAAFVIGTATITATGVVATSSTATLPATASITSAGTTNGTTGVTATATITATGVVTVGFTGTAALVVSATVTAGAQLSLTGQAALIVTALITAGTLPHRDIEIVNLRVEPGRLGVSVESGRILVSAEGNP
jgi:hypothetical protein